MVKFFTRSVLLVIACLVISGCSRVQPIYSVSDNALPADVQTMSLSEISKAIETAAAAREWIVTKREPGLLELTYSVRVHEAVVRVTFDQSSYSIDYVDSVQLRYNGGLIHRNYNRWVANLELDIRTNLQMAAVNQ